MEWETGLEMGTAYSAHALEWCLGLEKDQGH